MSASRRTWRGWLFFGAKWPLAGFALIVAALSVADVCGSHFMFGYLLSAPTIWFARGVVVVLWSPWHWNSASPPVWCFEHSQGPYTAWGWNFRTSGFAAPTWAVSLAVVLLAAALWWLDRRKQTPGICSACNYNRSGLPPGAPCPECGRPAPPRETPIMKHQCPKTP